MQFKIFITLKGHSLECLVTELVPMIDRVANELTKDNGTEWKWWPIHKSYDAKVETCNDDWLVCRSKQLEDLRTTTDRRDWRPANSSNETTTTPAPVPNECIACGRFTWKRIGVGEEEGEIFVSMGCYGSAVGDLVEEMSCTHLPSVSLGDGPGLSIGGGDIFSQCFCNEDKCNEGSTFSVKIGLINIINILGPLYGLLLLLFF